MAVPPEFIEDLRQRVPLSDIIGRRVKLVRKGRRFSGLCPFHSEKTPSFSVVDDDGVHEQDFVVVQSSQENRELDRLRVQSFSAIVVIPDQHSVVADSNLTAGSPMIPLKDQGQ